MSFIGIVSDNKCFEIIKDKIKESDKEKKFNLIHINSKSIENIKNIKFEVIIINSELEKLSNYSLNLERLCENSKYLILNTDINSEENFIKNEESEIITYGLNHKSTVTISSISESDILIYLQRNIRNIDDEIVEVEEKRINIKEKSKCKTYDIMILYIILMIYNKKIILEV